MQFFLSAAILLPFLIIGLMDSQRTAVGTPLRFAHAFKGKPAFAAYIDHFLASLGIPVYRKPSGESIPDPQRPFLFLNPLPELMLHQLFRPVEPKLILK